MQLAHGASSARESGQLSTESLWCPSADKRHNESRSRRASNTAGTRDPPRLQFSPRSKALKHRARLFPFLCSLLKAQFDSTLELCFFGHLNTFSWGYAGCGARLKMQHFGFGVWLNKFYCSQCVRCLSRGAACSAAAPAMRRACRGVAQSVTLKRPPWVAFLAACTVQCFCPSFSSAGWNLGCLKRIG